MHHTGTPSLLKFGLPTEIDFFDGSDDLEQKNNFWYKKINCPAGLVRRIED